MCNSIASSATAGCALLSVPISVYASISYAMSLNTTRAEAHLNDMNCNYGYSARFSAGDWISGSRMSMVWLSAPVLRLTVTEELGRCEDDGARRGLGLAPTMLTVPGSVISMRPERERLRPCLSLREFLSWGGRFFTRLAVLTACCISLSTN